MIYFSQIFKTKLFAELTALLKLANKINTRIVSLLFGIGHQNCYLETEIMQRLSICGVPVVSWLRCGREVQLCK